ncbi:MAG: LysM peptidoglycan-binding domain-containing protein, partial [Candidatus Pacebacteria bacterium]|nr:LysM peptidoglycan-binding domain-containing protein [Candidatus Paceibacterota bacterium]
MMLIDIGRLLPTEETINFLIEKIIILKNNFMKKLFISLLALLMTVSSVNAYTVNCGDTLSGIASQFGTTWQEIWENNPQIENPDLIYTGQEILIYPDEKAEVYDDEGNFVLGGAVQPIAGSTYNLSGSGVSSSATSITLNSLTLPQNDYLIQDSDLSDTFYITLEPGNKNRQEIVACTTLTQNSGGTATFSGCSRGMSPITPYTASSTLRFAHAGGTQVIFSDAPQLFNQFASLTDEQTIERIWTFDVHPTASSSIGYATTTYQYATKQYVDNVGAGGFTAANIGDGGTLRANGTSPETMDIATSTSEMVSFEI